MSDLVSRESYNEIDARRLEAEQDRDELQARVEQLEERHQAHLETIRRLSNEAIAPAEAQEITEQRAALMAEVGTLRAELAEAQQERDEARALERARVSPDYLERLEAIARAVAHGPRGAPPRAEAQALCLEYPELSR